MSHNDPPPVAMNASDFPRSPFNVAAVDEARALSARALAMHRRADDEQDLERRAAIRRTACALDIDADRIVPVEYRPDRC